MCLAGKHRAKASTTISTLASSSYMAIAALRGVSHQPTSYLRYKGNVNLSSRAKYSFMMRAISPSAYPRRDTPPGHTQSCPSMKLSSSQRQQTTRSPYPSSPNPVASTEAYGLPKQYYRSSGERALPAYRPIAMSVPLNLRAQLMRHEVRLARDDKRRESSPPLDSQMKAIEEAESRKRTARNFMFASMMQPSTVSEHYRSSEKSEAVSSGLLEEDFRITFMLDKASLSIHTKPSSPDPRVKHKMQEIGMLFKREQYCPKP